MKVNSSGDALKIGTTSLFNKLQYSTASTVPPKAVNLDLPQNENPPQKQTENPPCCFCLETTSLCKVSLCLDQYVSNLRFGNCLTVNSSVQKIFRYQFMSLLTFSIVN
eukprot:NODE_887_length_3307_cov_0.181733.p5 type:complete len:108 gc:universal NODE_887_length_3307_cov_0.181733:2805-2482(-)